MIFVACRPGIALSSSGLDIRLVGNCGILNSVLNMLCILVRMPVSGFPVPPVTVPLIAWMTLSTIDWKSAATVPMIPCIHSPESRPDLVRLIVSKLTEPAVVEEPT